MAERARWVEKERRKKSADWSSHPRCSPKVQIRKVIKTRNQSDWNIIRKPLALFTPPAINSVQRGKINASSVLGVWTQSPQDQRGTGSPARPAHSSLLREGRVCGRAGGWWWCGGMGRV